MADDVMQTETPAKQPWGMGSITIRPGTVLGPLLQRRARATLSPGQVAKRDLARYYLIIAGTELNGAVEQQLMAVAGVAPADGAGSGFHEIIRGLDQAERRTAAVEIPAVSPFLQPSE